MLLQKYMTSRKKIIEDALVDYLDPIDDIPSKLNEAIHYAVLGDAKRIRPLLMFATYETLRKKKNINSLKPLIPLAVALEMFHCASQVHENLPFVKDKKKKRGKPSVHIKYDEHTAILVADSLYTKAFGILTELFINEKAVTCIRVLARASGSQGLIGGQTVEALAKRKTVKTNIVKYIHLKKTGSLLQAATDLACIMAGVPDRITIKLGNFALSLAMSYHLIDDILEEIGTSDILDFESSGNQLNKKTNFASLKGIEFTKKKAESIIDKAYKIIQPFPKNELLIQFIDLVNERLP